MAEAVQRPDADETARLLAEWAAGRPENASELWTLLYTELKQIAGACMRAERPDHTLQTTALVHEAYLRMYGGKPFGLENRKHFFCAMARTMRRILVDHAREHHAEKRGGARKPLPLDVAFSLATAAPRDMLALEKALEELANINPRQAEVVEQRFFAGLTVEETAVVLDVSAETVKLDWRFAKAWLQHRMRSGNLDGIT
jgi:RNA polymerase sigma factor (TIGR02999 family)